MLSKANEKRDYRIFQDFGYYLINQVRPLYANEKIPLVDLENTIFALDSTSISVSINLAAWASGKYSRGAVKMHTLLDLRGRIPTFIHISDGTWHDSNLLDCLDFEPNAIYTMDKAYVDLVALDKINSIGAYFATRARAIMRYRVIEDRTCFEDGIITDQLVVFTGHKSSHLYPNALQMIRYHDIETNEMLIFISNNMDISALDIANIYRNRWQIEVFFQVDKAKYDRKTNVGLLGKCHTNAFVDSNYLLLADSEDKG